jgi:beta-lactamase class A
MEQRSIFVSRTIQAPQRRQRIYGGGLLLIGVLVALCTLNPDRTFGQTSTPAPTDIATQTTTATSSPKVDLDALAIQIGHYLTDQKFIPGTTRQGSVYIEDLLSGSDVTVNPNVVYSGVSMTKVAVLLTLYEQLDAPPTKTEAGLIARMIVCSDNAATNAILAIIGQGDANKGSAIVSARMDAYHFQPFVLQRTYSSDGTPTTTDGPVHALDADFDPYNHITPNAIGGLLGEIYRCATGQPNRFDATTITPDECRHMVTVLRADHDDALIPAGVPTDIDVAHKRGWSDDTHGDTALIVTPGGDYVVTIILHQRVWLDHRNSFPVIAEISRMVYNAYNPDHKLHAIHPQPIPVACPIDPSLINSLQQSTAPAI